LLDTVRRAPDSRGDIEARANAAKSFLKEIVDAVQRQWIILVTAVTICTGLSLLYLATAQSLFTATVQVVLDSGMSRVGSLTGGDNRPESRLDLSFVETQALTVMSRGLALSVVRQMKLANDPTYGMPTPNRLFSWLEAVFGSDDGVSTSDEVREQRAVRNIMLGMSARRVGMSHVLEVRFTAGSPAEAARIANAIAETYILDQLEARYQITQRATVWMQDRIRELERQAQEAGVREQEFRRANNIVQVGEEGMIDRQISQVNTALAEARAAHATARARLERIEDILNGNDPEAVVVEVLQNPIVQRLREQYLILSSRERDMSTRFGVNHQTAVNMRREMQALQRNLWDELRRLAETMKSDAQVARLREESTQAQFAELIRESQSVNLALLRARELTSQAEVLRRLHDSFLNRYTEVIQQQSFPITDARVISPAALPQARAWPRTGVTLILAFGFGLGLGVFGAVLRERMDRAFRTGSKVESVLGVDCLGLVPSVDVNDPSVKLVQVSQEDLSARAQLLLRDGRRAATVDPGILRYVALVPFSRFSETLRSVKVALDISSITGGTQIVGVISAVPNEGKSTLSANLANVIAHGGQRAIILDADLRNPSLTRRMAPDAKYGLLDVLAGSKDLAEVVVTDPLTGLDFLPAIVPSRQANTNQILVSSAMKGLLLELQARYDMVVLDLPPLGAVVDGRAMHSMIDSYLLVIEWGRTTQDVVSEALSNNEVVRSKLVGVLLNKVDMNILKKYDSYKIGYYYSKYYKRYYSDSK
jgi:succinoglycan biosynthesis transport protein ExoP